MQDKYVLTLMPNAGRAYSQVSTQIEVPEVNHSPFPSYKVPNTVSKIAWSF